MTLQLGDEQKNEFCENLWLTLPGKRFLRDCNISGSLFRFKKKLKISRGYSIYIIVTIEIFLSITTITVDEKYFRLTF